MRVLLDTHALLWFLLDDPKLSRVARDVIANAQHRPEVSPASYWEIAIKISLGKYELREPLGAFMDRELADNDIRILPILPRHAAALTDLPFHHRDPFDRLIIAQAMVEGIPVVSTDPLFDPYPVRRIWERRIS
ncbi:twitching motility protein PilT [Candidatus Thiodictyon syntrophicum]|uniref:Twitching motility protein PilT n=1 Tax=Candidatus Thiodictyon syntrophicum TaxID=1166950 RepID=A0A2K8UF97_9GAMM|nr:twitching motility protein PilT [Candidatus Thiodictyon syntrophicum]